MSIKDKIAEHIGKGKAYFNGLGVQLYLGSNADRECRKLVENNPYYSYFYAEPKGDGKPFKVFIRSLVKCVQVKKIEGLYHIRAYYNGVQYKQSKGYETQRQAMQSIKECGK